MRTVIPITDAQWTREKLATWHERLLLTQGRTVERRLHGLSLLVGAGEVERDFGCRLRVLGAGQTHQQPNAQQAMRKYVGFQARRALSRAERLFRLILRHQHAGEKCEGGR